jgi:hypothetical protein
MARRSNVCALSFLNVDQWWRSEFAVVTVGEAGGP